MNSNSNSYIFIYSVVMVVIVAALLSTTATLLKPKQEQNKKVEKMQAILASANIESTPENAESFYNQYITKEVVINSKGEVVNTYKPTDKEDNPDRAFYVDLKVQQFNQKNGKEISSPLFVCDYKEQTYYIIPMLGKGLWGPIWGNIALKSDMNTVEGVVFDHKGETPGLGAEIATDAFKDQFIGKTIFNQNGEFVSITVQKGGIATLPPAMHDHAVDAISGGTITSHGVDKMIKGCLLNYVSYIKNQK